MEHPSGRLRWPDAPVHATWEDERSGALVGGLLDRDENGRMFFRSVELSAVAIDATSITLPLAKMAREVAAAKIDITAVFDQTEIRGRVGLADADTVARLVRRARREGTSTRKAVMNHYGVSTATAARYIARARQEGALTDDEGAE